MAKNEEQKNFKIKKIKNIERTSLVYMDGFRISLFGGYFYIQRLNLKP